MRTVVFTLAAIAAGVGPARAQQSYLPLGDKNTWSYFRSEAIHGVLPGAEIRSRKAPGAPYFWVQGFPGFAGGVYLQWSGKTLYAWNSERKAWVAFLKFGVPQHTVYRVRLDHPLWKSFRVDVGLKGVKVQHAKRTGRLYSNCVRFYIYHDTVLEGQTIVLTFAPGVGLIDWTEQSPPGWSGIVANFQKGKIGKKAVQGDDQASFNKE